MGNEAEGILPVESRAKIAVVLLAVSILIDLVAAWSDYELASFVSGITSTGVGDVGRGEQIDQRQALIGMMQVGLLIVTAVFFLRWFRRTYENLRRGGLTGMQWTTGWAIGGFFVPILNLVRPYQIGQEIWKGSLHLERLKIGQTDPDWQGHSTGKPVQVWWALFILMSVIGNVSGRLMLQAENANSILTAAYVTLVSDIISPVAAVATITMIRSITEMQEKARMHFVRTAPERTVQPG